ncbi:homeobox-leucine zipper HOX11-like [Olea europaea subsp. europaea]|uniref:Homeobox-leucine zipper HOX11-like n=1 Tax=Olea europaea subsp. europaea TaxID=158383 RepID=A0A8S0UL86_OLEEU|nr:homeobox-leucine zipper HOX11-like [Olea europaea subsp. europaea]
MDLGLSLGGASKDSKTFEFLTENSNSENQSTAINQKDGRVFCMPLGLISTVGNQESHENYDRDDNQKLQESDGTDDHQEKLMKTSVQLDLLPPAPVPRHTGSLLRVAGSSEIGSSTHMSLLQPARGLDVNRPAMVAGGAAEEEVLSANDILDAERTSSRASDEDENNHNCRKKLRLSKEQSAYLEENFKEHGTLNLKQKHALAEQLNLRPRQVEVWFQNRRARTKLKQTEVDYKYLKRFCGSLREENRRLHKEILELRALNSTNPFCMQLSATTLTMCPSCELEATTSSAAPTTITTAPAVNSPIAKTSTIESTHKVIPFPLLRPGFYPFSCSPSHSNQSASS